MTLFPVISDLLLLLATMALAVYSWRLAQRLRAFNDVDSSLGAAIATLSLQVDDLKAALEAATKESDSAVTGLDMATDRANDSIGRLEMLIAAAEDVVATPPAETDPKPRPKPLSIFAPVVTSPEDYRNAEIQSSVPPPLRYDDHRSPRGLGIDPPGLGRACAPP